MQPVVLVVLHNLTHLVRVDGRVVLVHLSDFFPLKNKDRKSRSKRVNFSFILGDFYAFCLRGQFKAAFALQFLMPNSDLLIISDYIFFPTTSLHLLLKVTPIRYLHLHLAKQPRVDVLTGCQVWEIKPAQLLFKTNRIFHGFPSCGGPST